MTDIAVCSLGLTNSVFFQSKMHIQKCVFTDIICYQPINFRILNSSQFTFILSQAL